MKVLFITVLLFLTAYISAQPSVFGTCSFPNSNDYCFIAQGLANKVGQALQYRPQCVFQSRLDDITAGSTPFYNTDAQVFVAIITVPDLIVLAASNYPTAVGQYLGDVISSYLTPTEVTTSIFDREVAALEGGNFIIAGGAQEYITSVFQDANENNFVVLTSYNIGDCCPCQKYDFPQSFEPEFREDNREQTEVNIYFADLLAGNY